MCQKALCKKKSTYCPTCDGIHSPKVDCFFHNPLPKPGSHCTDEPSGCVGPDDCDCVCKGCRKERLKAKGRAHLA